MFELIKCIPLVPPVNPHKEDKIENWVALHNPKAHDGKCDPMKLEEWIKGM